MSKQIMLNPDKDKVKWVKEGIEQSGGFCPCKLPFPENKCPCVDLRTNKECICNLYVPKED